jgi:hypothetical protein
MADEIAMNWPGASGKTYKYYSYHKLKAEAGNYILALVK